MKTLEIFAPIEVLSEASIEARDETAHEVRPDQLIIARQKKELKEEAAINDNVAVNKVFAKCLWENKTNQTIIDNQVKGYVGDLHARRKAELDMRREKLSIMLKAERAMYENEFDSVEEKHAALLINF